MSTTLVRRTATESSGGGLQFSTGTSVATLLNDDSDTTYIQGGASNNYAWACCRVDAATFPAGAQIRSHTLKVRLSGGGGKFRAQWQSADGWVWMTTNTKPGGSIAAYQWTRTAASSKKTPPPPLTPSPGFGTSAVSPPSGYTLTPAGSADDLRVLLQLDVGVKCYRLEVDTVYNEQPVATVASIDGSIASPSFTTTSQRPVVWWTYTDPDGDIQERYQIIIFSDERRAQPNFNVEKTGSVWNSGSVASAANSAKIPVPLMTGTYWVYLRVADVGSKGRWSTWAKAQFTVAGSPPSVPTLISATADQANGRNVIVAQENDNLLGYQQSAFEQTSDGFAWYKDTNVTTLARATSAATNIEGVGILAMTATNASDAKIRSGGAWTQLGIGGVTYISRVSPFDSAGNLVWINEPHPVDDLNPGGGLQTASFGTTNGNVLVALVTFKTAAGADPTSLATVTSSPALTWTKQVESKYSVDGRRNYSAIFTATANGSATRVTVSGGTSGKGRYLKVMQYRGVNAAAPVGAKGHGGSYRTFSTSHNSTSAGSFTICQTIDDAAGWLTLGPSNFGMAHIWMTQRSTYSCHTMCRSSNTSATATPVALSDTGYLGDVSYTYVELVPSATPPTGVPSNLSAGIPVRESTAYTVTGSAWVATVANTQKAFQVDVEWYDSTGTLISTSSGTAVTTKTGNLLNDSTTNVTSPAGATSAVLVATASLAGAGEIWHWDKFGLFLGADQNWSRGGMQALNLLNVYDGSQEGNHAGTWVKTPGSGYATTTLTVVADANVKSGYCLETYGSNSAYMPMAQTGKQLGVDPGVTYTFYTMAVTVSGTTNGYATIQFVDDFGLVLAEATSPATSLSASTWAVLSVTATCPDGATGVIGVISSDYVAVGAAVKWTRHGISPSSTVPTAWQPGPMPSAYPLVESTDDGGDTWVKVRGCENVNYDPANSWQATVYDYEAPSNTTRTYRVSTAGIDYGIDTTGFYVVSTPSATADALLPCTDFYLVDPYVPSRFFMEQEGEIDFSSKEPQTAFSPLGRSTEIITYDVRKGKHFTFTLGMLSGAEFDAFETLRRSGHVLFLQTPYPRSWYVKIGSDQTTKWLMSPDATGRFTVQVELIEVARPA